MKEKENKPIDYNWLSEEGTNFRDETKKVTIIIDNIEVDLQPYIVTKEILRWETK